MPIGYVKRLNDLARKAGNAKSRLLLNKVKNNRLSLNLLFFCVCAEIFPYQGNDAVGSRIKLNGNILPQGESVITEDGVLVSDFLDASNSPTYYFVRGWVKW